jgi:hypothetical protein
VAVYIYTQTIHRTTQITTEQHKLQPNNTNNNIRTTQIQTKVVECGSCPVFASFTLAFALQLRKKHGKISVRARKTSVRVRKTSVTVQCTYYQKHPHITKPSQTHTLQNPLIHTLQNKLCLKGAEYLTWCHQFCFKVILVVQIWRWSGSV